MVCKSLKNLSKEDIQRLGEALGLSYTKLQNMNLFPDEMVAAWLKRQDDVLRTGKPTWRTLVDALREIDQNGIAEDILTERIYHHGSSDKSHRQQTMASKLEQELSKDNG